MWIGTQALWLQQGFQLEFLGHSSFVPGLWLAGILFFLTNCWLLGIIVSDIGDVGRGKMQIQAVKEETVAKSK
jgi:phosphatidylinositol glycan class M